jgi:hypothetical protein
MDQVKINVGATTFFARWESEASPRTCAAFKALLPYSEQLIHARWSGEACWIPIGGNLVLTITDGLDRLAPLGKDILNGSRDIRFEAAQ